MSIPERAVRELRDNNPKSRISICAGRAVRFLPEPSVQTQETGAAWPRVQIAWRGSGPPDAFGEQKSLNTFSPKRTCSTRPKRTRRYAADQFTRSSVQIITGRRHDHVKTWNPR